MSRFSRSGLKFGVLGILLLATIIIAVPLVFGLSHATESIIGYPSIWERTRVAPSREDLAGVYKEVKRDWDKPKIGADAMITLNADGTMALNAFPMDFGTSVCMLSGTGKWGVPYEQDELMQLQLSVTSPGMDVPACPDLRSAAVVIVGKSKPYRLYEVLSDPDAGFGVRFIRQ